MDYFYLEPFSFSWYLSFVFLFGSTVGFVCLGRRLTPLWQDRLLMAMGLFLLIDVFFSKVYLWYHGLFDIQNSLPLTFCTMIKFMAAYAAIRKSQLMFEVCLLIGLIGPVITFLMPYGFRPADAYLFFHYYISHTIPVIIVFYMLWCLRFSLRASAVLWVLLLFQPLVICVYFINLYLGSNYMFLMNSEQIAAIYAPIKWPYYVFLWVLIFYMIAGVIQLVSNMIYSFLQQDE